MLGLNDSDVLMMLWGLLQVIVIGIGAWTLSTLLALKIIMAKIEVKLQTQETRTHELEVFRQFAESKIKEMWASHVRDFRDSKPSINSHERGTK